MINREEVHQLLIELESHEMTEFIQLLSYSVLLSTDKEDWKKANNEFISIHIPKGVTTYINMLSGDNASKTQASLNRLILDLVLRGISSIALETGGIKNVEDSINNILEKGITVQ